MRLPLVVLLCLATFHVALTADEQVLISEFLASNVGGRLDQDGTFMAEKDSLITKCPSKFADEAAADPEHVVIDQ